VYILSTAPTPTSIFTRQNMLVYDHGRSTNSFNGAMTASPHPMILKSLILPTKLVSIIQYGGHVKAISLLPFWGNKLMEQVIHGEDFGPDLSKYKFNQVKAAVGEWITRYSAKSFFTGLL